MLFRSIDRRYKEDISHKHPNNMYLINSTSIIRDGHVWMANLAIIGSHSVNGVAQLHTDILKKFVLKDFYSIYPYKFNNKTNGVSHRRFLLEANPGLAKLISKYIGETWIKKADELQKLMNYIDDQSIQEELDVIKHKNKCCLSNLILEKQGVQIDPSSVFHVQVKRIHAYKRQLLNVFKIMDLYNRMKDNPDLITNSHTFIFAGKAAPGYHYAKTVIKLINTVADKVNDDKDIQDRLKVVFLENFNVTLAEKIYPAADVSEQISTASREASGTGNMKFMMNGAITIGTLDGANVEISSAVGDENLVIFGLTAEKVMEYYRNGGYKSWEEYHNYPRLKKVVDQLINGFFSEAGGEFRMIYDSLLRDNDEYFILKDFCPYIDAFNKVNLLYGSKEQWYRTSLINIAQSGVFSSDRTIRQYAKDIWRIR